MSHESIDTNRPYLVPRSNGNIEAWVVKTREDGTPVVNEEGWVELEPQENERAKYEEKGMPAPYKPAHPDALTDEVQGHYADILGQSRPNATPEQFERYSVVNDELAETALEAMGLEGTSEVPVIGDNVEKIEKNSNTDEFYEELAREYAFSSEMADRITQNLKRSEADEHFRTVRRHAADSLDNLIRESLHASQLPSQNDYEQIANMFRQAARSFYEAKEYAYTGDSIAQLASQIDASEDRADAAAHSYFRVDTPKNADELTGDIHRAKVAQLEIASILREEIQRQVDRIDREDATVDHGLSDISQRFMYMTEFNDTSIGNIYTQVQDMLRAISDSDNARHELDRLLEQLAHHCDDLKQVAEKFAK